MSDLYKLRNGEKIKMSKNEADELRAFHVAFADKKKKYIEEEKYRDDRTSEYPPIGDQLDALWKQINQWRLNGDPLIQDTDAILNKILAVKEKYPKPEKKK